MEKELKEALAFLEEAYLTISRDCEIVSKDEVEESEPQPRPSSQAWEHWKAL